eukprot:m.80699 g.80699  ORF g.80699 m.80699 type:complete len:363 (+) comp8208_c0_seq7:1530-2618(+)
MCVDKLPLGLVASKALSSVHREEKTFAQCVFVIIAWQVQAVEACVRAGKAGGILQLLDAKLARTVTALQCLEALERNTRGPRAELQAGGLLLGAKTLDDFPEPLDLLRVLAVALVDGMRAPVLLQQRVSDNREHTNPRCWVYNVDVALAAKQVLKFSNGKIGNALSRDYLVEAVQNRGHLASAPSSKAPLNHQLHKLFFVGIVDGNAGASFFELVGDNFATFFVVGCKKHLELFWNRILQHPDQRSMNIWVNVLHVTKCNGNAKDVLVKDDAEMNIEEMTVQQSKAHDTSDKLKVQEVIIVVFGVWVDLEGIVFACAVHEHAVAWVENLVREEVEPLAGKTTVIQAAFTLKLNVEALAQLMG